MTQRTDFDEKNESQSDPSTALTISTSTSGKKETPWYGHLHVKRFGRSLLNSFGFSPIEEQKEAAIFRTSSVPILESLFDMQPDELLKEIGRWLPSQPAATGFLSNLLSNQKKQSPLSAYVCIAKRFHLLLQPERILNKFLYAVVNANQKEAERILIAYPHLLSQLLQQKIEVTDYPGHRIHGAALQIALGAEDVKYHDDEECMAEMLMRYLRKLRDCETIIDKQIAEQFPEGWEEKEKARAERDSEALKKVVAALENAPAGDDCAADIKAFKDYLDDENKNRGVITTGKHFNIQLLVDALNLYIKKFDQFGGRWDSPKNILFWRKIIGKIGRYVPTCSAQALCQDVYEIVKGGEKLERRLTFRYTPGVTYYPLDTDPKFILGEDYCMVLCPQPGAGCVGGRGGVLQSMSNKKNQRREDYATGAKQSVSELACRKVAS